MSRAKRFQWGRLYLLSDIREGVFDHEPVIYVGKKDADLKRPSMCAVCGQPIGHEGYHAFYFMGPCGKGIDMMVGNGCIKDRIIEEGVSDDKIQTGVWGKTLNGFPHSGRWYGTFLHHSIAKPYVRDKNAAEKWDESILKLPGVRYVMQVIDELREEGYKLDAERKLECGNVDLLATHPVKGNLVFDWKSDLSFDNHEEYRAQVIRYMSEVHRLSNGVPIMGYIVKIREEDREPVRFDPDMAPPETSNAEPRIPIKCTLHVDMDGGEGIRGRVHTAVSTRHPYGDEASFYIPPCEPWKEGWEFAGFDCSPYREGERGQAFDRIDAKEGFRVSFICSKKRHSFQIRANWRRVRPYRCLLTVSQRHEDFIASIFIEAYSETDSEGNDHVEFGVDEINGRLCGDVLEQAVLVNEGLPEGTRTEWGHDDLVSGSKICIPCSDEMTDFTLYVQVRKTTGKSTNETVRENKKGQNKPPVTNPIDDHQETVMSIEDMVSSATNHDPAEHEFTPGRIYASGGRYYGIYKRRPPERYNLSAKVDVAEVDCHGKKITDLEWRHVYLTSRKKEYIYGLSNHEWKVYTSDVLADLAPEGMELYGDHGNPNDDDVSSNLMNMFDI